MKFGPVRAADAVGAILAHGTRAPAFAFKKGRVLSAADVAALAAAGFAEVTVARLEAGDVPEDEAAAAVAAAIAGDQLTRAAAFTGRCNLYAERMGLAVVDVPRLDQLNLIDEAITVATCAPYELVEARQMVATVKVIPFAAPRATVDAACAVAFGPTALIRVAPLRAARIGLIQTRLSVTKSSVIDKTVAVTGDRLAALGSRIERHLVVDHTAEAVAAALRALVGLGLDPLLVIGASAIVDRSDVIPAAVVAAGGRVVHFGMPVEPGNLLMLGRIADTAVIGLPGCARSPKVNGLDWVLRRLLAGIEVGRDDIMRMGAGGLIVAAADVRRPEKRAAFAAPRIAAIVLAAGQSTRMGATNKLLMTLDGKALVAHAVDAARASQASEVLVVVGHEADAVRAALAGRAIRFVDNAEYAEGLSASLRAGLAALSDDVAGVLFVLADMPRLRADHIDRLIAAFAPQDGRALCVPVHRERRGNPVLWDRRYFADLAEITGDQGGKRVLGRYNADICEVEMADDGVLVDVDTPEMAAAVAAATG